MSVPNRYDGRPILLIIEHYALAVIGELPSDRVVAIRGVVQHVWAGSDDWMATVRMQLGWEESIHETIRENWMGYQEAARTQKARGSAPEFAMMFADAIEKDLDTVR